MKWLKKQRENPDKMEAFAFADPEFWKTVDEQVLDIALDNARRKMESQMDAYHEIVSTSGTLIGWMVGAFISLSAAIVVMIPEGWTNALIMAVYGLGSIVAPLFILALGVHFKQSVVSPGMRPNIGLCENNCIQLSNCKINEQARLYKIILLLGMQRDIDYNYTQNFHRIQAYRCAFCILGLELIAGAVFFVALSCGC